jgi:hypothetical protein
MPQTVVKMGPDYRALRLEKLGIPWDEDADLSGVIDTPVTPLPESPSTTGQTIIPQSSNQKESSENPS